MGLRLSDGIDPGALALLLRIDWESRQMMRGKAI